MKLLAALRERVVLADGAMGTYLFSKQVPFESCLEELNISTPSLIRQIHEEYRDAGAELLRTNSFGANSVRLARHGCQGRVAEINRAAVELARAAAGPQGWVAGSVGPLGENMGSGARPVFQEQIAILARAGADVILFETFRDLRELREALLAAREVCTLPMVADVSPGEDGTLAGGVPPEVYGPLLAAWGADVVGCNCGSGLASVSDAIGRMTGCVDRPLSAQPSAGLPASRNGRLEFPSSPQEFGAQVGALAHSGASSLLGGCCGTTPAYIRALRDVLNHESTFAGASHAEVAP